MRWMCKHGQTVTTTTTTKRTKSAITNKHTKANAASTLTTTLRYVKVRCDFFFLEFTTLRNIQVI